jgi:hypothetical protein
MGSWRDRLLLVAVDIYMTCHVQPFSRRRSRQVHGQSASGCSIFWRVLGLAGEDGHLKIQEPYQTERKLRLRKYLYFGLSANACDEFLRCSKDTSRRESSRPASAEV